MAKEFTNTNTLKIIEVDQLSVQEFHALPNGQGPPTEMHITVHPKGAPDNVLFVLRLKSQEAATDLIEALIKHRDNIWTKKAVN